MIQLTNFGLTLLKMEKNLDDVPDKIKALLSMNLLNLE